MLEMCRRALPEELPNTGNLIIPVIVIIIINIIVAHPLLVVQYTNLTFTSQAVPSG